MTQPAQEGDFTEISALYGRRHTDDGGALTAELRIESQTFVARDEVGAVNGFAMVVLLDCGVKPYGIIHQLEVSPDVSGDYTPDVRNCLTTACVSWLQDRGVKLVYARHLGKGAEIKAMLRYTHGRQCVIDPVGGQAADVRPARGDRGRTHQSRAPGTVQAADAVWN